MELKQCNANCNAKVNRSCYNILGVLYWAPSVLYSTWICNLFQQFIHENSQDSRWPRLEPVLYLLFEHCSMCLEHECQLLGHGSKKGILL